VTFPRPDENSLKAAPCTDVGRLKPRASRRCNRTGDLMPSSAKSVSSAKNPEEESVSVAVERRRDVLSRFTLVANGDPEGVLIHRVLAGNVRAVLDNVPVRLARKAAGTNRDEALNNDCITMSNCIVKTIEERVIAVSVSSYSTLNVVSLMC
jgi:hypothetical protein